MTIKAFTMMRNPSGTPCHLPLQERLNALRAIFLNIGITILKPPLVRGGAPKERRGVEDLGASPENINEAIYRLPDIKNS